MLFDVCPHTSRTPKFWHTCVITYGDFMGIVETCRVSFNNPKSETPLTLNNQKELDNVKQKFWP